MLHKRIHLFFVGYYACYVSSHHFENLHLDAMKKACITKLFQRLIENYFLPTKYYAGFLMFKATCTAEYDFPISLQALEINEFKNLNVSDFMIANSTGLNW